MARNRKFEKYNRFLKVFISVIFASLIYVLFYLRTRDMRLVKIPLNIIESSTFKNNSNIPEKIELKLLGSRDLVYSVDISRIKAYLDFSVLQKEGIYNVPIRLDYDIGFVDERFIEVCPTKKEIRISFVKR